MYKKVSKAYKFYSDIYFGLFLGGLTLLVFALLEYNSFIQSKDDKPSFFQATMFVSIYFSAMEGILIKAKKNFLVSNGFTRKTIFKADILAILTLIPFIAIPSIVTELIYTKCDGYVSTFELIFKKFFSENSYSQMGSISLSILWAIGNSILLAGIVYLITEINFRLSKKGKIIFYTLLIIGDIILTIGVVVLYKNYSEIIGNVFGFAADPIQSSISKLILSLFFYIPSYRLARRCPITK